MKMVDEADINIAQKAWGDGIVAIASAHLSGGDYVGIARNHVETLYAYGIGTVLFKPTLAAVEQFRPNFESALSYFVASNNACTEDSGFAIKNWKSIEFNNYKITEYNNYLLSMGNYFFKDQENEILKVEYTFGFIKINNNELRINLHHSSLPYGG